MEVYKPRNRSMYPNIHAYMYGDTDGGISIFFSVCMDLDVWICNGYMLIYIDRYICIRNT